MRTLAVYSKRLDMIDYMLGANFSALSIGCRVGKVFRKPSYSVNSFTQLPATPLSPTTRNLYQSDTCTQYLTLVVNCSIISTLNLYTILRLPLQVT
jgi:hypothetical protein